MNNFDEIKNELRDQIESGSLNRALRTLRDVLREEPGNEDALFFTAVALNRGMHRSTPEQIEHELRVDKTFDPLFAQCAKCGIHWVPDPTYKLMASVTVTNPAGGFCPNCNCIYCRNHFLDGFRCPDCNGNLEAVKEPNGRRR